LGRQKRGQRRLEFIRLFNVRDVAGAADLHEPAVGKILDRLAAERRPVRPIVEEDMLRVVMAALGVVLVSLPAAAQVGPFPASFRTQEISTNGATIHVRIGGRGAAVVLLHGYGETGDMWVPLAAELVRDHMVVVPDLRGIGHSSRPSGGYDKKTQAGDVAGVLDALKIEKADLVTHDIGNMVGYAFAAQYPGRVTNFVLTDAPLPGVGPWDQIVRSHGLWHFSFWGPDAERLVAGRERIYLDRFWNEFSADPKKFSEASRQHYAKLYAQPASSSSRRLIRTRSTTRRSSRTVS
jgi:pimeloyl-ACP methyl ester carboxylesterase